MRPRRAARGSRSARKIEAPRRPEASVVELFGYAPAHVPLLSAEHSRPRRGRDLPRARRFGGAPGAGDHQRREGGPGSLRDPGDRRRPARRRPDPALRLVPEAVARASLRLGASRSSRTGTPSSSSATRSRRAGAAASGAAFPGVKVANRGISGDTTRGVLIRLQEDVLALDPAAVVLLIGTNDLEEGATPEVVAGNLQADPRRASSGTTRACRSCSARCSRARRRRSARRTRSRPLNALYLAAVKNDPQVTYLETWPLFADAERRRDARRVPRPAASQRGRLREVGGGAAPRLRDARLLRDRRRSVRARGGVREPLQRPRSHGLGLSADVRGGQGERHALAGLGSERRRLAVRRPSRSRFDGLTVTPDGRFAAINGRLVVTTPPEYRKIQQLWTTREFPAGLRPEARVPRHARTPTAASTCAARSCSAGTTGSPDPTRS